VADRWGGRSGMIFWPIPAAAEAGRSSSRGLPASRKDTRSAEALSCRLISERKLSPMTVSSPNVIEIKLDRLINDVRFLRAQIIGFDRHLQGMEVYLKPSEQPESQSRSWFRAAGSALARTVLTLVAVGAATGAALHYLGT